jgi:hypothetical protein
MLNSERTGRLLAKKAPSEFVNAAAVKTRVLEKGYQVGTILTLTWKPQAGKNSETSR